MTLSYVNNFKVLPMTGEDNSGLMLCKFTSLFSNFIEYNTEYTSQKSQAVSHKSKLPSSASIKTLKLTYLTFCIHVRV